MIEIKAKAGEYIPNFFIRLIRNARLNNEDVVGCFNDVKVTVNKKDKVDEIAERYYENRRKMQDEN